MKVEDIHCFINELYVYENIQELIKDMKATQHGDRTNPFYELSKDYHQEGGVWKHTLLAINFLPEVASKLASTFDDGEFIRLYEENETSLRNAALFHDVGKIPTKQPSTKRTGSFSFPSHGSKALIDTVLNDYGIAPSPLALDLAGNHHASPEQFKALQSEWKKDKLKLLIILKAADSMAVGTAKNVDAAIEHVSPFVALLQN